MSWQPHRVTSGSSAGAHPTEVCLSLSAALSMKYIKEKWDCLALFYRTIAGAHQRKMWLSLFVCSTSAGAHQREVCRWDDRQPSHHHGGPAELLRLTHWRAQLHASLHCEREQQKRGAASRAETAAERSGGAWPAAEGARAAVDQGAHRIWRGVQGGARRTGPPVATATRWDHSHGGNEQHSEGWSVLGLIFFFFKCSIAEHCIVLK